MFLSDVGTMSMMMMLALTVLSVVGRVTLLKFGLRLCWECVAMMIKVMVLLQSLMQNWPHYVLFQSIYTTQILRFRNRVLETSTNMCSMCTQLIHLNTKSSVKWAHEFIIRVMWWICDSNALLVRFMAGKNTSVDTSWRFLYLTPPSPATSVVCRFMTGWPLPWHETRGWLSPLWRIIGTLLLSFRPWTTTLGWKESRFCLNK